MIQIPSPAIAIVGRHNSGKTTLIEKLISELVERGLDIGTVKHHHKPGFEFDVPGKDSWRHRQAGASETVIASIDQIARVKTLEHELECSEIVSTMPGHDLVIVEGYRKSGLPTIEIMRRANEADLQTARAFAEAARTGQDLGTDFTQKGRGDRAFEEPPASIQGKAPTADTVAVVTDIPEAREAAGIYGIPAFDPDDIDAVADFLQKSYVRKRLTVVVQAGGESRRMGRSKATVPFCGDPLICRLVRRLYPVADEFIITTNEAENLGFLKTDFPDYDIRLVPDEWDTRGALPGLYTALKAASNQHVAVVACDMVFASPNLVLAESVAMTQSGCDVVVPVNKHGFEPFHSVYRRSACLPVVKAGIEAGDRRAQYILDKVKVRRFTQDEVLAAEPRGRCFINANYPDELHALEKIVMEGEE